MACLESPGVWQSQREDPDFLAPRLAPFPRPHLLTTRVAAASSGLGLGHILPSSATNQCWLSPFPHLQDGGGLVPETPWSPPNPGSFPVSLGCAHLGDSAWQV